jgi:hypothetical protein
LAMAFDQGHFLDLLASGGSGPVTLVLALSLNASNTDSHPTQRTQHADGSADSEKIKTEALKTFATSLLNGAVGYLGIPVIGEISTACHHIQLNVQRPSPYLMLQLWSPGRCSNGGRGRSDACGQGGYRYGKIGSACGVQGSIYTANVSADTGWCPPLCRRRRVGTSRGTPRSG